MATARRSWADMCEDDDDEYLLNSLDDSRDGINLFMKHALKVKEQSEPAATRPDPTNTESVMPSVPMAPQIRNSTRKHVALGPPSDGLITSETAQLPKSKAPVPVNAWTRRFAGASSRTQQQQQHASVLAAAHVSSEKPTEKKVDVAAIDESDAPKIEVETLGEAAKSAKPAVNTAPTNPWKIKSNVANVQNSKVILIPAPQNNKRHASDITRTPTKTPGKISSWRNNDTTSTTKQGTSLADALNKAADEHKNKKPNNNNKSTTSTSNVAAVPAKLAWGGAGLRRPVILVHQENVVSSVVESLDAASTKDTRAQQAPKRACSRDIEQSAALTVGNKVEVVADAAPNNVALPPPVATEPKLVKNAWGVPNPAPVLKNTEETDEQDVDMDISGADDFSDSGDEKDRNEKENDEGMDTSSVAASESMSSNGVKKQFPVQPVEELTESRIEKRQRQIDIGKSTEGYKRYLRLMPKAKRRGSRSSGAGKVKMPMCPSTPDKKDATSKRSWDSRVRRWRRALHEWDAPDDAGCEDVTTEAATNGNISDVATSSTTDADETLCATCLFAGITKETGEKSSESRALNAKNTKNNNKKNSNNNNLEKSKKVTSKTKSKMTSKPSSKQKLVVAQVGKEGSKPPSPRRTRSHKPLDGQNKNSNRNGRRGQQGQGDKVPAVAVARINGTTDVKVNVDSSKEFPVLGR